MKKIIAFLLIILTTLTISSCVFGESTTYPDMVEYTEDEVLKVAKEKYNVTEWIFSDLWFRGITIRDTEGNFKIENHSTQFSTDFLNGDNIESAMTAFAGKNGGHDTQGRYKYFLCYIALGKCSDSSLKFIYYNTNIHKDAEISNTVGASDYPFEVLPTEITNDLFTVDSKWHDMTLYLNKYKNGNPRGFDYSGEYLTIIHREQNNGISYMEFYKEKGHIAFDLYNDKNEFDGKDDKRLVYSTSNRYGVIYNYYGLDKSQYFNVTQMVTPNSNKENTMLLLGQIEAKELNGNVLYSEIGYHARYQVLNEGKIIERINTDTIIDCLKFTREYCMDKINGVDHTKTAAFTIFDFYILYEKNVNAP